MLKKIKYSLFVIALLLQISDLAAQSENISPYSRYGIGDIKFKGFTPSLSMGGTGIAFSAHNMPNILNPASYSELNLVTFGAGVHSDFIRLETEDKAATENYTNLSYLNLAFPLRKDTTWGLSFGIIPYSNVDYSISVTEFINGVGTVERFYEGSGGYNQVYVGTGFKIGKSLAVGANVAYLFGNIEKVRKLEFPGTSSALNTQVSNSISISDIAVNAGLQAKLIARENESLVIGITAGLPHELSAKRNYSALRYTPNGSIVDTILIANDERGNVSLPLDMGFGFMYKKRNVWQDRDQMSFGADYSMQDWSSFEAFGIGDSLRNSYRVSIGGEYLPDDGLQASYMERMYYRFGMLYNQSYLEINETALQEYGITFGLGLPMKPFGINRAPSYINIGVQLGMRGTTDNNLIQEQFTRILLGFTLNDNSWFRKRKYD